ncbi:MAG: D-alanyl-D-alanine carboxypeptidase/D-alanyl-D-alanine-endopeptidase [Solirubrobacterales bacterium]
MPSRALTTAVAAALLGLLLTAAPAAAQPAGAASQALPGPDRAFRSAPAGAPAPRVAARRPIGRAQLRRKLRRLARRAPGSSGYFVTTIDAGKRPIFDRNAGRSRKLASNEKLFTTTTALHRLGPKWRIPTRVKAGPVSGRGRLRGDVYLVGGGDPSFDADGIADLARQVRRSGIRRIGGSVVADDSVFDRRRGVPDSSWGPSPWFAPLSGLVYNGSTYDGDPAKQAALALRAGLRDAGVRVGGKVRVARVPPSLRDGDAIAEHDSSTIAALVRATNKDSVNFYAEMLLKRLWATAKRKGTTNGGVKAVERFARQAGSKVRARDGSGLTAGNRSSPRDVARLLIAARRDGEIAEPLFKSLSIAGKDGTLVHRMNGSAAAGSCRGKTGTLTGVSNLSGYCRTKGGLVVFSLLMNGVSNLDAAHQVQDEMVIEIARLR